MLRAATAASGGAGAPLATYCSIWAWTLRTRAWISTPDGVESWSSSARTARNGDVCTNPSTRIRPWPWTIARTVPSWSWTTWAIFAMVPTAYSSEGSPISSCSGWRCVTRAIGPPVSTAALSAATLFSRPTWSGTIISGKMTVSRRATSGSSRGVAAGFSAGVDGLLAIRVSLSAGSLTGALVRGFGWLTSSAGGWIRDRVGRGLGGGAGCVAGRHGRRRLVGLIGLVLHAFLVQDLQAALAEALTR